MSTERKLAVLLGLVLTFVGVAGFMPVFLTDGNLLLGVFAVDDMHNEFHILSGIIALLTATKASLARVYFKIFGLIYGIIAVMGFAGEGNMITMQMNRADNWLHLIIAIIALYTGFIMSKKS